MAALEIALCFTAGLFLLILTALLFRLSFKGIARLLLNAAFGGVVLLAVSIVVWKLIPRDMDIAEGGH